MIRDIHARLKHAEKKHDTALGSTARETWGREVARLRRIIDREKGRK